MIFDGRTGYPDKKKDTFRTLAGGSWQLKRPVGCRAVGDGFHEGRYDAEPVQVRLLAIGENVLAARLHPRDD